MSEVRITLDLECIEAENVREFHPEIVGAATGALRTMLDPEDDARAHRDADILASCAISEALKALVAVAQLESADCTQQVVEEGEASGHDFALPDVPPIKLNVDEATAIVSAAFSEDHDRETFDAAIKRLGDWVDFSLALKTGQDRSTDTVPSGVSSSKLAAEVRYHEHHERKATAELDAAGVKKFDHYDSGDSTDDSAGGEWSIWKRIQLLRRDRDRIRVERDSRLTKEWLEARVAELHRRAGDALDRRDNFAVISHADEKSRARLDGRASAFREAAKTLGTFGDDQPSKGGPDA